MDSIVLQIRPEAVEAGECRVRLSCERTLAVKNSADKSSINSYIFGIEGVGTGPQLRLPRNGQASTAVCCH